jgi:hypothetical protein
MLNQQNQQIWLDVQTAERIYHVDVKRKKHLMGHHAVLLV